LGLKFYIFGIVALKFLTPHPVRLLLVKKFNSLQNMRDRINIMNIFLLIGLEGEYI